MAWQPIETAPKIHGEKIWAYIPEFEEQAALRWVDDEDWWAGWQYIDSILSEYLDRELEPSHWMPLPSPPTTNQE